MGTPKKNPQKKDKELIRLNRFIANSGICSRREADVLIKSGKIRVNGNVITTLGTKVSLSEKVQFGDKVLIPEKKVYVLLNKPKDFITTTDDPQNRKTVMDLVRKASDNRIYPVGRLDRNTTGLLLLTNDGDLAKKLSHPSHKVKKVYHIKLDKGISEIDLDKISQGLQLEDGEVKIDKMTVLNNDHDEIGLEIHIGKNRIVKRIFESLGYEVLKLDRVIYAGFTKKDLPRGKWRHLKPAELVRLKHY